jgi:hypothetical protein
MLRFALILWCFVCVGRPAPATPTSLPTASTVRRLLTASCGSCHAGSQAQGGLRVDTRAAILRGGVSGAAIVPGAPEKSLLLARIRGHDKKPRMPLGFSPLEATQERLVASWIAAGAPWDDNARHWAYVPPKRPVPPAVKDRNWPKTPIDRFIRARLERENLAPSPEADRATLLRRVSLDLIGLPPSPEELDAFETDRRPDAYARRVDALLARSEYGERWARPWLDLARYADTHGYEKDARRSMWPWRDWVIRALNADMPFDRFTIRQLAGDLLPGATIDDRIATGFHRNTMTNEEGGVDPEEARWLTNVDRVGTTGTVWLGSTLACAQCHDHKYDPIPQKDFYRFLAFFEHTDEPTLTVRPDVTTLTLVEKPDGQPATCAVRVKGAYLVRGETVTAGMPSFGGRAAPVGKDRLALARWLVSPQNPLTARVTVNRAWEAFFGRGLVETTEDFGTQGSLPTHPALLDWLATEFVRLGWSQKQLHRTIVLSAVYRQSARLTPALLARDPQNRLLARGPRFRMEAEMLRDSALEIGGLLSHRIGGPSVFPRQPDGIWNIPYSGDRWTTSDGEDRYRRGLYTFWRRTAPYPAFTTFDATSREFCTARRIRTNTPLQALALLNDPAFLDAARGLAVRMKEAPGDPMAYGFRACTARRPTRAERARLQGLYTQQRARYRSDLEAAKRLGGSADPTIAALTVVANVLLNLDETVTKG